MTSVSGGWQQTQWWNVASGYSPRRKQKSFSYRCFLSNLTFLAPNSYSRRQQVGIIVVRFIWAAYDRLALLANKPLCQNNREGGETQGHLSPRWITGCSILIYFFQYRFPKLTCTLTAATCQQQSPYQRCGEWNYCTSTVTNELHTETLSAHCHKAEWLQSINTLSKAWVNMFIMWNFFLYIIKGGWWKCYHNSFEEMVCYVSFLGKAVTCSLY